MGATVTTGRRVGAFVSPAGKTIYVLFEQTYEKNVTPYRPEWSCIGIGELAEVIRRIFIYGSSCEGGMLQNRSGHITPEGYIRSWFDELEAPREMRDFAISLKVGNSFYATIKSDKIDRVTEELTALGRLDILSTLLEGESVSLSFQRDADIVLALYGLNGDHGHLFTPWLIVRSYNMPGEEIDRDTRLGYSRAPIAHDDAPTTDPTIYRCGSDDCFVLKADGSLRPAGWAYSLIGDYVLNLWSEEMRFPRSFSQRIKAFRKRVETARRLAAEDLTVLIDTNVAIENAYEARTLAKFQRDFKEFVTGSIFEMQPTEENFYRLQQLPSPCVRWELKGEQPLPAQTSVQVSLF